MFKAQGRTGRSEVTKPGSLVEQLVTWPLNPEVNQCLYGCSFSEGEGHWAML